MWCLTYLCPCLFVWLLACSFLGPCIRAVCHIRTCLFKHVPVLPRNISRYFGKCYSWFFWGSPCSHVLVFVSGVVSLSLVACNVIYQRGVAYIGACLVSIITCFPSCSLSYPDFLTGSSCSICCSMRGVVMHIRTSLARRRWLRYSPSILKLLVFQAYDVGCCLNSLCDMVSPCHTPLLMLMLLLLYRWTVIELCLFQEFHVHILFLELGQYWLSLHWVEGFPIVDERDGEWDILSALLL